MFICDPKEPEGARASRPRTQVGTTFAHALVSETLDLASAFTFMALNIRELEWEVIDDTLGIMLKYQYDIKAVRGESVSALPKRSRNRGPRGGRRRN